MLRILFVQPYLGPPGGAAGVAAWMLDLLAERGAVTLLTTIPFHAESTDLYYGTTIAQKDVSNIVYGDRLMELLKKLPLPSALLQIHFMMRGARKLAGEYDLVFSAFDEQDFGVPCVEYIHFPWNYFPRPDAPPHWNESVLLRTVLQGYRWFCRQISGFRSKNRPANLTLVNSAWTGRLTQSVYPDTRFVVMHPPALAQPVDDDRSRRQPRFLSIGRVASSKEWLKLIDIVSELRQRGHNVGLTLAGSRDQREYEALVRRRIEEVGPWAQLVTNFSREELQELMVTHEYGLHGMRDEHYGMAVAELILGGCLTMVPDDGGQVEIVTDERLRYSSQREAVEKLDRVLSDPELKARLLADQQAMRPHLTKERFLEEFGKVVDVCQNFGIEEARRQLIGS